VRIFDPALDFDSGAQEPGETVEIDFPATGSFLVFCGIHPKMELYVDVVPKYPPSPPPFRAPRSGDNLAWRICRSCQRKSSVETSNRRLLSPKSTSPTAPNCIPKRP